MEHPAAIAALAEELLRGIEEGGRTPVRKDLMNLRQELKDRLSTIDRPVEGEGIGLAAAAGYLADSPYWLEWWRNGHNGEMEFVSHSLNPNRDSFYDYASRRWFLSAAEQSKTTMTGPYVDVGGTNTYTVTAAFPVLTTRGLAAVAGMDIPAAKFERFLLGSSAQSAVVLANSDLRVIASNTGDYLPGDLLDATAARSWARVPVLQGLVSPSPLWHLLSPGRD